MTTFKTNSPKMNRVIKVFAPATVSNIGCGFDTMGFALHEPGEEVSVKLNNLGKIRITKIIGDEGALPTDIKLNTASVALTAMLKKLESSVGIDIEIRKKMPLFSGLGSSAASAVGAVFAANELLDRPFTKIELLEFALAGEKTASITTHADNVAPCLLGGFTLIRDYNPVDVVNIPFPKNLYCTILYPQIKISTAQARSIIKKNISLKKARRHFGNIGALVKGLITDDLELIGKSINDEIAEPVRAKLIPGYFVIKKAAIEAGAIASNISGSGPSIFALCKSAPQAKSIGASMKRTANSFGLKSKVYVSTINPNGVRQI